MSDAGEETRREYLLGAEDFEASPEIVEVSEEQSNVGKTNFANKKETSDLTGYDPFANVGKSPRKVLPMPTLAKSQKLFDFKVLQWYRAAGKPLSPKGFYWQSSGSKTVNGANKKKRIVHGWTLVKNGKCQGCRKRYRPPIAYLNGEAWNSLKGESYERQKAEIRLLLGKCQRRLNDLRCSECLSRDHSQVPIVGRAG